jgi:Flp pilus assembly protein TadD
LTVESDPGAEKAELPGEPASQSGPPAKPDFSELMLVPVLAAVIAFWPVLQNSLVDWDDYSNFVNNRNYLGLGWPQIRWAWTTFWMGVYQPLAWMLLEGEYAFWGLNPWGFHLGSLALYAAATAALYVLAVTLLERCRVVGDGKGRWRIQLGAAIAVTLFAVHPLRTEVVAWVSCQPYLPSTLFAILTVLAYLHAHPDGQPARAEWVAAALGLFVAGLLSKAVVVNLPLVLILLDVYPLRRIGGRQGVFAGPEARRAWLEKVPYLSLAGLFMALAMRAKQAGMMESGQPFDQGPPASRLAHACYSACFYLAKTVWPAGISAFYPLPGRLSWREPVFLASIAIVAGITLALLLMRRRWPGALVAWLSYLILLAPVSGLVRISSQVAADRYAYPTMIGLAVLAAAVLARILATSRRELATVSLATLALVAFIPLDWKICRTWRDSLTFWSTTLAQYESPTAHYSLGLELQRRGKFAEAADQFAAALAMSPDFIDAHANLVKVLAQQGKFPEAHRELAEVLRRQPDNSKARNDLGAAYVIVGKFAEADEQLQEALRHDPNNVNVRINLGTCYAVQQKFAEAEPQFLAAARLDPGNTFALRSLAKVLARQSKFPAAEALFAEVLRRDPGDSDSRAELAAILRRRATPADAPTPAPAATPSPSP